MLWKVWPLHCKEARGWLVVLGSPLGCHPPTENRGKAQVQNPAQPGSTGNCAGKESRKAGLRGRGEEGPLRGPRGPPLSAHWRSRGCGSKFKARPRPASRDRSGAHGGTGAERAAAAGARLLSPAPPETFPVAVAGR